MLFILTFFCLAVASPVFAQTSGAENYPNRGVRIVVPFPPGGPTDTYARILADKLQTALGQSFVVENKPRATGLIGTLFVANAPADGYTLLLGANSSHVISSLLQPQRPLDPLKVFRPLSMLLSYPLYLLLNKDGAGRDRCRAGGAWQVEAGHRSRTVAAASKRPDAQGSGVCREAATTRSDFAKSLRRAFFCRSPRDNVRLCGDRLSLALPQTLSRAAMLAW